MSAVKNLEWKSKKSDVLVLIFLFLLTGILLHAVVCLNGGKRHHIIHNRNNVMDDLTNPSLILMSIVLLTIIYSPFWLFKLKVPKRITFDLEQGLLIIQRRKKKKEQLIALDGIGYMYYERKIFAVLEIYHNFETSRRGSIRKRFRTIMVPFWGMSINRRDLKEIVTCLKEHGGAEERLIQKRSFEDLMSS